MAQNKGSRTKKQVVGDIGEDIVCRYLSRKGYRIIERNYRKKWGEIDIIAQKNEVRHFVEVKTVSDIGIYDDVDSYRPEENVHPRKLKRLARAVATYLANSREDIGWQFDIAAVFLDRVNKRARVRYLKDVTLENFS